MKKWITAIGGLCVLGIVVYSGITYYLRNQRLTPTPQQIQAVFPNNTRDIFEHSDKFILLSLDPHSRHYLLKKPIFHQFYILGQTEIKDPKTRARIRAVFDDAIVPKKEFSRACFNPRHGIRAIKNGKVLDFVICFHCRNMRIYLDNKAIGWPVFKSSHQDVFDKILSNAHVPLPD